MGVRSVRIPRWFLKFSDPPTSPWSDKPWTSSQTSLPIDGHRSSSCSVSWPVLPTSLSGAGQELHVIVAAHPDLPGALDAATAAQLPAAGWRLVARRRDFLAFTAPSREPGAWAVVAFDNRAGRWRINGRPGIRTWHPNMATRQAGLRLAWPPDLPESFPAGELPQLAIHLINTRTAPWTNAAEDDALVAVELLDAAGHRLPPPPDAGAVVWVSSLPLAHMDAEEVRTLPVYIRPVDPAALTPGRYQVNIRVTPLDLPVEPLTVRLE
jgi:hypothetical protein